GVHRQCFGNVLAKIFTKKVRRILGEENYNPSMRCRVIFFDVNHHMNRRVELDSETPETAAVIALRLMLSKGLFLSDFDPTLKVEVVKTEIVPMSLATVAEKVRRPKVA